MQDSLPYADIIILALVAGFILLRLRSILGQNPGEKPDFFKPAAEPKEPIIQLADKSLKAKPKEDSDPYMAAQSDLLVLDILKAIKEKDVQFNATHFLEGAKIAFEMVQDAFHKGDREALKMLLSDDLFETFSAELASRAQETNKRETTIVSVQAKDITQATLNGNKAHLTVRFISEQIVLVRDTSGAIIEGNPSQSHHVEDVWGFERDVTSKSPNWKIVET